MQYRNFGHNISDKSTTQTAMLYSLERCCLMIRYDWTNLAQDLDLSSLGFRLVQRLITMVEEPNPQHKHLRVHSGSEHMNPEKEEGAVNST